jgi:hypothetical protein
MDGGISLVECVASSKSAHTKTAAGQGEVLGLALSRTSRKIAAEERLLGDCNQGSAIAVEGGVHHPGPVVEQRQRLPL